MPCYVSSASTDFTCSLKAPSNTQTQPTPSACLWIAIKLEEADTPPRAHEIILYTGSSCSKNDLIKMEAAVCFRLQFRLQHVTPFHFADEYLIVASISIASTSTEGLRRCFYFLLDLSRFAAELIHEKPSVVAAGSLYLALATVGCSSITTSNGGKNSAKWTRALRYYTGYEYCDLKTVIDIIGSLMQKIASPKRVAHNLVNVYEKHKNTVLLTRKAKTVALVEE